MAGKNFKRPIIITLVAGALGFFLLAFVLLGDFDNDGLNNLRELSMGTNVFNPDTDVDGLIDGQEVNNYNTNPLIADSDMDGLADGIEVNTYRTDPLAVDSDNDGLKDGDEVNGVWHLFEVRQVMAKDFDPSLHWTLEHSIWDGKIFQRHYSWTGNSWTWPYDQENVLKDNGIVLFTSNPLLTDTDGDGLKDSFEFEIGTDPRSKDTDNDDLDDFIEFNNYQTSPIFYDTDGDLLGDREEKDIYLTDPLNWDCDNDHLSDGIEVKGYDVDGDGNVDVNFPAFGANPLVKDIFVEVDWMPGAKTLGSYSIGKLIEAFARHEMVLHIDQGELGGGAETEDRADRLYDNRPGPMNDFFDFKDKYFTALRRGTFFWCLITSSATYIGKTEVGGSTSATGLRWPEPGPRMAPSVRLSCTSSDMPWV